MNPDRPQFRPEVVFNDLRKHIAWEAGEMLNSGRNRPFGRHREMLYDPCRVEPGGKSWQYVASADGELR